MNWLIMVLAVLKAVPVVVKLVEPLFGPSSGTDKKLVVATVTETVASIAGATPEQVIVLTQAAGVVTDATVNVLNAIGVFKKEKPNA